MERLSHDLHPTPRGKMPCDETDETGGTHPPTKGMPAMFGVEDVDVLQGEGLPGGEQSSQLPGAAGAPGQVLERRYDLVVVEPDLPGLSGYALCSWYKEMCRRKLGIEERKLGIQEEVKGRIERVEKAAPVIAAATDSDVTSKTSAGENSQTKPPSKIAQDSEIEL